MIDEQNLLKNMNLKKDSAMSDELILREQAEEKRINEASLGMLR